MHPIGPMMAGALRSHAWLSMAVVAALTAACSSGTGSAGGGGSGGTGSGPSGTGSSAGSGSAAGSAGSGASAGSSGSAGSGGSGGTSSSGGFGGSAGSGTGGTGGTTGSEICGNEQDDDADGFYDCDDVDCFDDSGCINGDLDLLKMSGFVPCGKPVAFSNADSDAICQMYALGWSPQYESRCQFASYSGTVSFYCSPSPKTDAIGLRWVVHGNVPTETINGKLILWETLMGEYAFGNGGGSGSNPLHKFFDIHSTDHEEDFVGYDLIAVDESTKGTYTNWFAIWDLSGGQKPQISGGFTVQIDAAQLFATN